MQDLVGKVFLVTGATDGIGKAAALNFARRGATITIVGRNKLKTEQVLAELKAATGNDHIELLLCDLSRMADVRRAAEEFKAKHDRLDVLVNNAGATFKAPVLGPDGYELTFALNHLAYFQLTMSLLDLIRTTPGARVVSTSSAMQARGTLDLQKTPTTTRRAADLVLTEKGKGVVAGAPCSGVASFVLASAILALVLFVVCERAALFSFTGRTTSDGRILLSKAKPFDISKRLVG